MAKSATLTTTLSPEGKSRLAERAKREQRSEAEIAAELIEGGLAAEDDFVQVIARRQAVPPSERRYVRNEDVTRWLASWGTDDELPPPEPTISF